MTKSQLSSRCPVTYVTMQVQALHKVIASMVSKNDATECLPTLEQIPGEI